MAQHHTPHSPPGPHTTSGMAAATAESDIPRLHFENVASGLVTPWGVAVIEADSKCAKCTESHSYCKSGTVGVT
jgi:hypothetical protein